VNQVFYEFKLHLGYSPIAYQLQSRLQQAATLLKKNQQATQTSFALGFTNSSHFSRCFKKFHGISPGQYKERY